MPSTPAAQSHTATRAALEHILAHIRNEPSRTWSIIVTLYGDAIVPRGGCVWLGTLLSFFNAIDISDGVVRQAVSRLASDGWLERIRSGRNSFYRLADKGSETFRQATEHIYMPSAPQWQGGFELLIAGEGADPEFARVAADAGFGMPAPGVWITPSGSALPVPPGMLKMRATGETATSRALAARAWPLDATGEAYRHFLRVFEPLRAALKAGDSLGDLNALVARVLLIHEYRRIVLRDPILPLELLPTDWPGTMARALCADIYGHVLPGSERWLDQNAIDTNGVLPPPGREIYRRFKG